MSKIYRRKISILLRPRCCFIFTGCYKYVPIVMMRLLIFLRNLYHIFPRMLSVSDAIILILKLLSTHGVLNMLFMPQKRGTFLNHSLTTAEQLSINTNQHSIQYIWENITATRVQMESNFKINYVTIICNISSIMIAYTYLSSNWDRNPRAIIPDQNNLSPMSS